MCFYLTFDFEIGGAVGSGLEKAGDVLGSGISKAGDVTGDIIETFGDKENQKMTPTSIKDLNELLKNAKVEDNDAEWLP